MKLIILAAGRGSRMGSLTEQIPKCLIVFNGVTLIERQLGVIDSAGITDVALVTGYKRELLPLTNKVEFYNPDWQETNILGSLMCADEWLSQEPCIVTYSDIFYQKEALLLLKNSNDNCSITYDPDWLSLWSARFQDPLIDAESFRLDSDSYVIQIGGRVENTFEIEGQFMGLLKLTPSAWQTIKNLPNTERGLRLDKLDITSMLNKLIQGKFARVRALRYDGIWGEVDSSSDLDCYQRQRRLID